MEKNRHDQQGIGVLVFLILHKQLSLVTFVLVLDCIQVENGFVHQCAICATKRMAIPLMTT